MSTHYRCIKGHVFTVRSLVKRYAKQIYCYCGSNAVLQISKKEYERARNES